VNRPAKLDEKQVEIALQMHREQLVDVAHLSDPYRSQYDLRGEENSQVAVSWYQTMDGEYLSMHFCLARYRQTTRRFCHYRFRHLNQSPLAELADRQFF
jgi:hypothetical protein